MAELFIEDSPPTISPDLECLLNTAYCARILAQYVYAYQQAHTQPQTVGTPYLLAYLCLPLTLRASTRKEVNKHTFSYGFHRFISQHPTLLIYLAEHIQDFISLTQASLLFGVRSGLIELNLETIALTSSEKITQQTTKLLQNEKEAIQPLRAAARLGTWFSQLTMAEIFFYLDLHP